MECPRCGGDLKLVKSFGDGYFEPVENVYKCKDCCYGDYSCDVCDEDCDFWKEQEYDMNYEVIEEWSDSYED